MVENSMNTAGNGTPLVQVSELKKHFPITQGLILEKQVGSVKAVDGISFEIQQGETLGLVGESGCGKTTAGRTILGLYPITDGSVNISGITVETAKSDELKTLRRKAQMIFQDPYASLNPRWTVSAIIGEPLRVHKLLANDKDRTERVKQLMLEVGLSPQLINRFPHEFSGGQRQRIGIARALASGPEFVVCDEPISALDVSIQAQVVNLLEDLQDEYGLTFLFIAHDLSMVRHICDRVAQRAVREPPPPLYPGAAFGGTCPRSEDQPPTPAYYPPRRCSQPDQSALGLPLPPALPDCQGALLADRAGVARDPPRSLGRLPRSELK